MASNIIVQIGSDKSVFSLRKLERAKLYGKRRRLNLDLDGQPCTRAELTHDGSLLIKSGMTSQGYFDEERNWIPRSELVGIDAKGKLVEKVPSTLGVAQDLEGPVPVEEILDLSITSVYMLDAVEVAPSLTEALDQGDTFRFQFNYRADYHAECAYLVKNSTGMFVLVGSPTTPQWCELERVAVDTGEDESILDDDLDFDMF